LHIPGAAPAVESTIKADEETADLASCEACFFGLSALCTLPKKDPCATFRSQLVDMGWHHK